MTSDIPRSAPVTIETLPSQGPAFSKQVLAIAEEVRRCVENRHCNRDQVKTVRSDDVTPTAQQAQK